MLNFLTELSHSKGINRVDAEHSATTIRVLKNRYSGETGVAGQLTYDLDKCKFTEHEAEPDFNPATDF